MTSLLTKSPVWVVLLAAPALASSAYPTVVERHLGLSRPIPASCGLCHTNGLVGAGTVNTPFGKAARAKGLVAFDDAKLVQVLDALEVEGTDSDGDGVGDLQELRAGTDPNVSDRGGPDALGPLRYGCGAEAAPGALEGLGLAAWLLARQRWRRRAGPSRASRLTPLQAFGGPPVP